MKIAVLAGGLSPERNVSLSSGVLVTEALRGRGHQVALVDLFVGLENWTSTIDELYKAEIPSSWRKVGQEAPDMESVRALRRDKSPSQIGPGVLNLCQSVDAVFLALHGSCGEDGRLQATLDLFGIPYTGSGFLGSAIAMDKDLTKRMLEPYGIRTPQWQVITYEKQDIPNWVERLVCPCVVKPMDSGSSIGVSIAYTSEELSQALQVGLDFGGRVIVEQYVQGREIQVGVLEGRALPSIEIIPKSGFYDYANKYQPDSAVEVCPAEISEEVEKTLGAAALEAHQQLGLSVYSRSDFILDENGAGWFLEINTLPGMTPTSLLPQEAAATGIDYPTLCERILMASLEARTQGRDHF